MKSTSILKVTEEYTENKTSHYRLPNTAGEGAVLRFGDKVIVTDHAWGGFVAGIYEFIEDEKETGFSYVECRLNLIAMAEELFPDGGHAVQWALEKAND